MHKAYVVGAGIMGAAVVAAAAVVVLVFAGLYTVSPGVGRGHRAETREHQPSSTTAPPSSPSTTTERPPPGADPETGRLPLPPSHPVAIPDTNASAPVPARPSSNFNGSEQLSSASSPLPSGAPTPAPPTAPVACQSKSRQQGHRSEAGGVPLAVGQPSKCSKG
jgi:hypothetical protein